MWGRVFLVLAAPALAGCERHGPPAKVYRHLDDRLIVAFGLTSFLTPCSQKEKSGGGTS
jgi:hypothetical protein